MIRRNSLTFYFLNKIRLYFNSNAAIFHSYWLYSLVVVMKEDFSIIGGQGHIIHICALK